MPSLGDIQLVADLLVFLFNLCEREVTSWSSKLEDVHVRTRSFFIDSYASLQSTSLQSIK
jgi:hypothetical protein